MIADWHLKCETSCEDNVKKKMGTTLNAVPIALAMFVRYL